MSGKKSPIKTIHKSHEDSKDNVEKVSGRRATGGNDDHDAMEDSIEGGARVETNEEATNSSSHDGKVNEDSFLPLWADIDEEDDGRGLDSVSSEASAPIQRSSSTDTYYAIEEDTIDDKSISDFNDMDMSSSSVQEEEVEETMDGTSSAMKSVEVPIDTPTSLLDDFDRVNYYESADRKSSVRSSGRTHHLEQTNFNQKSMEMQTMTPRISDRLYESSSKILSLPLVQTVLRISLKTLSFLGLMYLSCLSVFVIIVPYLSEEEYY